MSFCGNGFDHPAPTSAPSTASPHAKATDFINIGVEIPANDILESIFDIVVTGGVYMECFYFSKNFPMFTRM